MPPAFNIAPRVVVYTQGTSPPVVEEGWVALGQLESAPAAAAVGTARPGSSAAVLAGASKSGPSGAAAPPRRVVFGDGSHATTRLCAAAVDLLCRQRPGMAVLDVGTGTGILARIARARGTSFVVGTDIDLAAVACAKAHAELDNVGAATDAAGANCATGGIYFGNEAPDHWGPRFDLVVANILEAPLHSLAPALCRALVPGGVLLIGGFTRPQVPALRRTYESVGLKSAGDFILGEWVLLKFAATFPAADTTPG